MSCTCGGLFVSLLFTSFIPFRTATVKLCDQTKSGYYGYGKFQIDTLGDHHLSTSTTHSGVKKAHDWGVDQFPDLFHTTHKVILKARTRWFWECRLTCNIENVVGPVTLVLDLHEVATDKIRKYRVDYN